MPTVAFDFFGTLYSFDKVIDRLRATFPSYLPDQQKAERVFYQWLWSGLRDYFGTSHAGRYCPLLKVLRATLSRSLRIEGFPEPNPEEIANVMDAFSELTPAATAIDAIELLKKRGWDIWIVTNGSSQGTSELLRKHGLLEHIHDEKTGELNLFSCDDLRISKPHPKVYSEVMRLAVHRTRRIENFYLVASHAWDLAGAKNVSFRTAFLTTEEVIYPADMYGSVGPDVEGDTLLQCVERIMDLESKKSNGD